MEAESPHPPSESGKIIGRCIFDSHEAYGYYEILINRIRKYGRRLKILAFVGFLSPIFLGLLLSSNADMNLLKTFIVPIAAVLGGLQLIISLWTYFAGWDSKLKHAYGASSDYLSVHDKMQELIANRPDSITALKHEYDLTHQELMNRIKHDAEFSPSFSEKCFGMRMALRQFQAPCIKCEKIPDSMEPTGCAVCGKFTKYIYI